MLHNQLYIYISGISRFSTLNVILQTISFGTYQNPFELNICLIAEQLKTLKIKLIIVYM